ncbi:hypothetical protein KP509_39G033100 [Ceratopteris richardii]|uniref:Uncharacterized protein n=1 Tax=Ceratopteris richardii TaxID=49495 RepID=A0A8T2Q0D8_CERRI|nr:hypothetical protein KP509_39G033100 [Ceratopteris richardii]
MLYGWMSGTVFSQADGFMCHHINYSCLTELKSASIPRLISKDKRMAQYAIRPLPWRAIALHMAPLPCSLTSTHKLLAVGVSFWKSPCILSKVMLEEAKSARAFRQFCERFRVASPGDSGV